jgi:hypothetical protein
MSANTGTIRVRIFPGVRAGQALLLATALVASLLLGLVLGRVSAPAGVASIGDSREFAQYACTGHVPTLACLKRDH